MTDEFKAGSKSSWMMKLENNNTENGATASLETKIDDFHLAKTIFEDLHKKALSMGLNQHQLRRLKSLKRIQRSKDRRFLRLLLQAFMSLSIIVLSCMATWYLDWPISRNYIASLVWRFRGKNIIDAEEVMCLFYAPNEISNVFRPPTDCNFCRNVSEVTKVPGITSSEFQEKYAYSSHPVVVTDGATNWSAINKFSFKFFRDMYGPGGTFENTNCQFFEYKSEFHSLADLFTRVDETTAKDGSKPWYIGWSNCDVGAANILRQYYSKPYFLPENSESSKTDWIFMGSPRHGAIMHVDNVQLPSWQAQLTGHKEWTLAPPSECYWECGSSLTVTVHPGEIIVLDTNRWFHSTLVTGDDISITIGSEFD